MDRLKVWVFMGGPSAEHDVSLVSGRGLVQALDHNRFEVTPVFISKEMEWCWTKEPLSSEKQNKFELKMLEELPTQRAVRPALDQLPACDIALLGLHGRFGEDGTVQALLDYFNIPYTGSGRLASALAMHKVKSKEIYRQNNIPTADWAVISRDDLAKDKITERLKPLRWPLFFKDPEGGSSIDMGRAENMEEAKPLIQKLLAKFPELLAESFIQGRECSIGWLEGAPTPLPPTEIITEGDYFDFEAKYQGKSREVTPAPFSPELTQQLQELAEKAHTSLGCAVYSRTDFIVDEKGNPWALETNTLPGFTPTSLLPQQAAAIGLNYSALVEHILRSSLERFGKRWNGWS